MNSGIPSPELATMDAPIVVQYRWTVDECLAAHRQHLRSTWQRWIRPIVNVSLVLLAALSLLSVLLSAGQTWLLVALLLASIAAAYGGQLIQRRQFRRAFCARPDADAGITFSFTAAGISTSSALGTSDVRWEGVHAIIRSPEGFLLYPIPRAFHWLPLHGFAGRDEVERFAAMAQSRVRHYRVIR